MLRNITSRRQNCKTNIKNGIESLTAVEKIQVFWDVIQCRLIHSYGRFEQSRALSSGPKDEGASLLQNVGNCSHADGLQYPRRLTYSVYKLDVHGSVHHNTNHIEIINKMQPCTRIYYSNVYKLLNMFRATHRSSSGAQKL
jgi:hypothetical protein